MTFEQEWAGARATATGHTAGAADLRVPAEALAAVGGAAYGLYQRLTRDGDHARPATFDASLALHRTGFRSGPALLLLHDRWNTQLRTLLDACAHVSDHLRTTNSTHAALESGLVARLSVARIDSHFH
ncbi:hypothetical protein [Streptomyces sp. NPDC097619]|uniref:hypothetical protein n=1 Tax=Streptomyces sp. NPDC097619 TaxID=3157228 RepID=UPI0033173FCA